MPDSVPQNVGIDISKDALDVCVYPEAASARFGNDKKGFTALMKWLGARTIARLVFEPTGAYHRAFEARFLQAGFTLAKVNPRQARRFAEAIGKALEFDGDIGLAARMRVRDADRSEDDESRRRAADGAPEMARRQLPGFIALVSICICAHPARSLIEARSAGRAPR